MDDGTAIPRHESADGINEDDVFVLSPHYRLHNERDRVDIIGWKDKGDGSMHHTHGIILALCNGRRTVREVAQAVVPFAPSANAQDALRVALNQVRQVIWRYSRDNDVMMGKRADTGARFSSNAPLMPVSFLASLGSYPGPEYDPKSFLPQYAKPSKCDPAIKASAPNALCWHVTDGCQVDCRYCYLNRRKISRDQHLPLTRALEILDECREIGVCGISLGGGDVLLYPHLFPVLEVMRKYRFFPTDLSIKAYCSREVAQRLREADNIGELQVSLDSTVEEVADYLTRTRGFCRKAFESIDNLVRAGMKPAVKVVVTPYNILTVPRLCREMHQRGVAKINVASYSRSGYHHTDDLFNHEESYRWLEAEIKRIEDELGIRVGLQNGSPYPGPGPTREDRAKSWPQRLNCGAGRKILMICADGKVIPCEQLPEVEGMFCGDVRTQSLQEVWEGRELAEKTTHMPRERFQGQPCYTCEDFESCVLQKGLCIRDACLYQGSIYVTPMKCPKYEGPFLRVI
jgi:radical SAM protein with 4Fe4S-binding SPASM domain